MLRHVASQMLKWLNTVQEKVLILKILPVITKGGYISYINKTMTSDHIKASLEMARAVKILSTVEIFLLLSQSMMFTSIMNPFPKLPIMISTPKMISNMYSTINFIVTKRCSKIYCTAKGLVIWSSKRTCLCDSWKFKT